MLAILFLVLSGCCGFLLLERMVRRSYFPVFVAGGLILGTMITTWSVFLLAFLMGIAKATLVVTVMLPIALIILINKRSPRPPIKLTGKQKLTMLALGIFWTLILLPLFNSRMLATKPDGLYSGGNTWGDIAIHATYISRFAQMNRLDFTSPIYAQEKTTYPFLMDFFTSILWRLGFSLQLSLVASGFALCLSTITLLYLLMFDITKSRWISGCTTLVFLFNGGLGFFYAIKDYLQSGQSPFTFLFSMKVAYTNLFPLGIYWSNIITDFILPQRAIIAGLATFMLMLTLLRTIWVEKSNTSGQEYLVVLLISMLPFVHVHTFLVSIGVLFCFIAAQSVMKRKFPSVWIFPLAILILLSAPQLVWQFGHSFDGDFMRLQWGWMKGKEFFLLFWLKNMGLEFVFMISGGLFLLLSKRHSAFFKVIFFSLVILFLIANLIVFQPYDYDNSKFFLYTHLAVGSVTSIMLYEIWKRKILGKLASLLLIFLLTVSGVLAVLRESYTTWRIAQNSDLELATFIKNETPLNAVFLTSDSHNHPVTMLAGRTTLMGYRGWLWTHGINYRETEKDVVAMLRGYPVAPELITRYNVSYAFIGDSEKIDFAANDIYFASHFPVIFKNQSGTLYELKNHP